QLVGVVFVLTGFLAHAVEALAQAVTLGHQQFALLGIEGHAVEGFLQLQARLTDLFVFQGALLAHLGHFVVETRAAQRQLLGLG
ncbi:hypothetical protein, partial [Enterococcus faecalis]|uniref:hypothetical protein n=1 Tax=Enterococcus faecalis TaxID=1351 RepID=UPI003CC595B6